MKTLRSQRGMTLSEVLVASTIMLFVCIVMYTLILTTQTTQLTEGRKLDMNQGARVTEQMLSDAFRSAGAMLTMANTPIMLGPGSTAPFMGVYPINNVNSPDGVILAAGDPDAFTKLTAEYTPNSTYLDVVSVAKADGTLAWHLNDLGLVMRPDGYYVFKVTAEPAIGDTRLTVRSTAVYYSGLLDTANNNDQSDDVLGSKGNINTYAIGNPVVRLDYFYIFAASDEHNGSYTMTLSTDLDGVGDIFAAAVTDTRAVPLLNNLVDLQIDYVTEETPPVWWASGAGNANPCPGANCVAFISKFTDKSIASARISMLLRTEEETNKIAGSGIPYAKPDMGDAPSGVTLAVGRFHYTFMRFEALIRNFSNVY